MVEDSTIRDSSPTHMDGKGTNEDPNDSFGPKKLKAMTETDECLVDDYYEDSVNTCRHLKTLVVAKESDRNVVKDILVDEGVCSQNKNDLKSEVSYKLRDPTQAEVSESLPEISSKRHPYQADANDSLDFGSLLDQVEVRSIMTGGVSNDIADKSYLDELFDSTNNPFLEEVPVETRRECERDVVSAAHTSNPFEDELSIDEPEDICIRPEETSNNLSLRSSVVEGVVSGKNPFLDSELFKAAKDASDDANEAMTISAEVATFGEAKKTASDDKAEASCVITVDSGSPGAGDKVNLLDHSDNPANVAKLQLDPFESSFATTNPYPTSISYSGQIPFSGSISHRSESSATSNRSFAFPVLQTEWNTSPVRMAKANRKHNRWRHSLLCCKF